MEWAPGFIGIGAEKSATTWAWTVLDEHPEVCMSQPKELNFFNIDENYIRGTSWYRKHFSVDTRSCGEISPLYMDDGRTVSRIRDRFPSARILVMLRNPFDRAMSHLFHDASVIYGNVSSLTPSHLQTLVRKDDKYIRRSSYHSALQPYFDVFPRSQIGVFFFDDVKADGLQLARRLYRFAGVSEDFVPEQFNRKVNESQDLRSLHHFIKAASRTARSFPPARICMEWIYRHTRLREKVIESLMVDRGRAEITFDQAFCSVDAQKLSDDLHLLNALLPEGVPAAWMESEFLRESAEIESQSRPLAA